MRKIFYIIISVLMVFPICAMASVDSIQDLILYIGDIIGSVIPIAFSLALLAFLWGVARFIWRVGGDEKAIEDGKRIMIWGLIALFVMASVWGIVGFIRSELGVQPLLSPNAIDINAD